MLFNFCILSIRNGIKYEKKKNRSGKKGRQLRVMSTPLIRIFNKKCFGTRVWEVTGVHFEK